MILRCWPLAKEMLISANEYRISIYVIPVKDESLIAEDAIQAE